MDSSHPSLVRKPAAFGCGYPGCEEYTGLKSVIIIEPAEFFATEAYDILTNRLGWELNGVNMYDGGQVTHRANKNTAWGYEARVCKGHEEEFYEFVALMRGMLLKKKK